MPMTRVTAVLAAAALGLAADAAAQSPQPTTDCRVTDLMPAFWPYWEAARDADPADQYRLFAQMVRAPNAELYDSILHGLPASPDTLVPRAMRRVRPFEPTMRALSGQLASDLPRQLALFRQSFPDFRCETPIYFLFAAGAFDGAVRQVGGQPALLFGMDVIARIHGQQLTPLVVHELFHLHHDAVIPSSPSRLYWAVWKEGLATYVSRRLNPDVDETQVCCLPDVPAVTAALPALIPEVLARLDSEREADYARYLLGGATDIPARSGYYLGYRVAAQLGETLSLAELARLPPEAVRPMLESGLRTLR